MFDFGFSPASRLLPLACSLPFHCPCRVLDRVDDVLIAGATAEVAVESVPDLFFRRLRIPHQQLMRGENHPRSAETALQPVTFPKGLLERMELFFLSQPFNCQNLTPVGLNRKNGAGLNGGVVLHNFAPPPHAGVAPDGRTR